MRHRLFAIVAAVMVLAGSALVMSASEASAASIGGPMLKQGLAGLEGTLPGLYQEVQRRRGFRRGRGSRDRGFRRGRRGNTGAAIAGGIAGAIALGIIANSQRNRIRRDEEAWHACADRFVSFRWSDGTYQPYGGGPRRLCPYLLY